MRINFWGLIFDNRRFFMFVLKFEKSFFRGFPIKSGMTKRHRKIHDFYINKNSELALTVLTRHQKSSTDADKKMKIKHIKHCKVGLLQRSNKKHLILIFQMANLWIMTSRISLPSAQNNWTKKTNIGQHIYSIMGLHNA